MLAGALAVVWVWARPWPGSCSPACPKVAAVAWRAQEIQWAWVPSLGSHFPGQSLLALQFELGTLSLFWSPGPEMLLEGSQEALGHQCDRPQAGPDVTSLFLPLGTRGRPPFAGHPDTPTFWLDPGCPKAVCPHSVRMPPGWGGRAV